MSTAINRVMDDAGPEIPLRPCSACDAGPAEPCHDDGPDLLGRLLADDDPSMRQALGTTAMFAPTAVDLAGRW